MTFRICSTKPWPMDEQSVRALRAVGRLSRATGDLAKDLSEAKKAATVREDKELLERVETLLQDELKFAFSGLREDYRLRVCRKQQRRNVNDSRVSDNRLRQRRSGETDIWGLPDSGERRRKDGGERRKKEGRRASDPEAHKGLKPHERFV